MPTYCKLFGEVLYNAGQQTLAGFLGAKENKVDVLISTQEQSFGQYTDPHYSLQCSVTWKDKCHVLILQDKDRLSNWI